MEHYIRSTRIIHGLLAAAITITLGAPLSVHAAAGQASQQANDEDNRKKIREANYLKQKAQDPLYADRAKALAEQYRETAENVARQGGNPHPILDAATYFQSQADTVTKVRRNAVPIEIPEPVSHPKVQKK
jgi:hypothetical protein